MSFFTVEDGMLLGLAARQKAMAQGYEGQIAYLTDLVGRYHQALEAERRRNEQLQEALEGLGSNDPIRKILGKALADANARHKEERERLEAQVTELRSMVEQRDAKIGSMAISHLVQSAALSGVQAQVKAMEAHHPDSSLLASGEVPGHPDLSHRPPLRTEFDKAYSATLKSYGITTGHLEQISTAAWKPVHPEYLERDPAPEAPADDGKPARPGL